MLTDSDWRCGSEHGRRWHGLSLEAYKAVRAYELELHRATLQFEHAILAPLFLLNGGAAVAELDQQRQQAGIADTCFSTVGAPPSRRG